MLIALNSTIEAKVLSICLQTHTQRLTNTLLCITCMFAWHIYAPIYVSNKCHQPKMYQHFFPSPSTCSLLRTGNHLLFSCTDLVMSSCDFKQQLLYSRKPPGLLPYTASHIVVQMCWQLFWIRLLFQPKWLYHITCTLLLHHIRHCF
jgi:hypothetical protein